MSRTVLPVMPTTAATSAAVRPAASWFYAVKELVAEFVEFPDSQVVLEYLPPCVPKLNPVEYLWGRWKRHDCPKSAQKTRGSSPPEARRTLNNLRPRPRFINAFWRQAFFIPMNSLYYAGFSSD